MEDEFKKLESACKEAEHAFKKGLFEFPLNAYELMVEFGKGYSQGELNEDKAKLLTLLLSLADAYFKDDTFNDLAYRLERFFREQDQTKYPEGELNNYVFARLQKVRPTTFNPNAELKYYWLRSYNDLGRDSLPECIIKPYALVCNLHSPIASFEYLMHIQKFRGEALWQEFAAYFLMTSSDPNSSAQRHMIQEIMDKLTSLVFLKYLTKYSIEEYASPSLHYPIGIEKYSLGSDNFRTRSRFVIFAEIKEGLVMTDDVLGNVDVFSCYETTDVDDPILSICYFCAKTCPKDYPLIVCVKCTVRACTVECFEKNCEDHNSECEYFSQSDVIV